MEKLHRSADFRQEFFEKKVRLLVQVSDEILKNNKQRAFRVTLSYNSDCSGDIT
jgi:hypothetical protein